MIKAKRGDVMIKGSNIEIMAEIATIISSAKDVLGESEVREAVELGLNQETVHEKAEEVRDDIDKLLEEIADRIIEGLFDGRAGR